MRGSKHYLLKMGCIVRPVVLSGPTVCATAAKNKSAGMDTTPTPLRGRVLLRCLDPPQSCLDLHQIGGHSLSKGPDIRLDPLCLCIY